MLNQLLEQARELKPPEELFVNRPNGYDFDLPDNILIFSRGGLAPVRSSGSIHHRYLLNLNLDAPCQMLLDGRRFQLESGSAFLIYPYENHLFMHTDERIFRLMITFEVKRRDILPARRSSALLDDETLELAGKLLEVYRKPAKRWELTLRLTLLLSRLRDSAAGEIELAGIPEGSPLAARVVKHLLNHLESDLGLEALAREFHLSRSQLRRRFREEAGVNLGEYVRSSRAMKAMYYLNRNEKSIGEIAELCGYSSLQAFSRAFRAQTGTTPLAYRLRRLELRRKPE